MILKGHKILLTFNSSIDELNTAPLNYNQRYYKKYFLECIKIWVVIALGEEKVNILRKIDWYNQKLYLALLSSGAVKILDISPQKK